MIRKKLTDEDKARKYFFYAIGEITLVVIGILIALQVNNWNEERKEETAILGRLDNIRAELAVNISLAKEAQTIHIATHYLVLGVYNRDIQRLINEMEKTLKYLNENYDI